MIDIRTDIAQHLHNQGIGVMGSNLFTSYSPQLDSGDFTIAVLDTGGMPGDIDIPTDRPTFQVFVRAKDYPTGRAKLNEVYLALHKKMNQSLVPGGTYFYWIRANSHGGHIGRNESDQDEFSVNFVCYTRNQL